MTLDDYFRDQISRGQQPMVALNNAAQAYAEKIKLEYRRPDCSQYADETQAWGEQSDSEAVKIHERLRSLISSTNYGGCRVFSISDQCQCPLCDLDRLFQLKNRNKDSEAVELLREARRLLIVATDSRGWSPQEVTWFENVLKKFLRSFQWSPQPDITTYELARCLAVLLSSDPWSASCAYDHLPDECKRHFEVKQ